MKNIKNMEYMFEKFGQKLLDYNSGMEREDLGR